MTDVFKFEVKSSLIRLISSRKKLFEAAFDLVTLRFLRHFHLKTVIQNVLIEMIIKLIIHND
jgi:hypothetical protein